MSKASWHIQEYRARIKGWSIQVYRSRRGWVWAGAKHLSQVFPTAELAKRDAEETLCDLRDRWAP